MEILKRTSKRYLRSTLFCGRGLSTSSPSPPRPEEVPIVRQHIISCQRFSAQYFNGAAKASAVDLLRLNTLKTETHDATNRCDTSLRQVAATNHLVTPVLRELRWLTVTQQLYLRDAVFTFKCMTGCAPDYLRSKLVTRGQASGRVTRNSQQLNIPLFRTATGQRSFQYRAVSLWNSLDKDLKLSKNHEVLKRKLKHILRDT